MHIKVKLTSSVIKLAHITNQMCSVFLYRRKKKSFLQFPIAFQEKIIQVKIRKKKKIN